jgi:transposase-like protein
MRNLTLCDDGTNALCAEEDPKGLAIIALIGMNFLGTTARRSISIGDWLEENIAEALNVLALPEHLRKRCASTNSLERLNQEIKRRTNVTRIYPNRESLLRVVASLCEHISERWAGRCYLPAQELVAALQTAAA